MRAVTVWPEFVWAIQHLGKDVENRTWFPPLNPGEELAIHAGKSPGGTGQMAGALASLEVLVHHAQLAGWESMARVSSGMERGDVEVLFSRLVPGELEPERQTLRLSTMPRGAVVAVCTLGSILDTRAALSPWANKQQNQWPLEQVQVLPVPVPCRGYQRIWYLPPGVEQAVREQLEGDNE